MLEGLEIGHIKLKKPIIQGGMGIGVSLGNLAGAVSLAGGLGVISAAQVGFKKPLFEKNAFKANMEALEEEIKKAKEISKNGFVGVNIMAATEKYDEYVKKAVESGADLIISGAGIAKNLPQLVKGTNTLFAPIFSSLKATKVILKVWDKRDEMMPDAIVIEGPKAGGHLGFSVEDLDNIESLNYDEEVKQIVDHVKIYEDKYNKKIPVIFAGGVTTKEDVNHYLNLGVSGVQVATKFVATYECDAHQNFKDAYINAKDEDVSLTISPVGLPGRGINNLFLKSKEKEPVVKCYNCLSKCDFKTTPYCITKALIDAVNGDVENGLVFCGRNVGKVDKMKSVEEVMNELV